MKLEINMWEKRKMSSIKHQYVCVLGYGWSGSSAVVDLLKEFEENWDPEVEFRILKDPHGMMDLEHSLVERWDALNVDIAIRDFLEFAEFLDTNDSKFTRGLCYSKSFNGKFMSNTLDFVERVTEFNYKGYWWIFNFRSQYINWLAKKILNKFVKQNYEKKMYFSGISKDNFYEEVKKYINSLIEAVSMKREYKNIILDQAVPVQHPLKAFDYLDNSKVIIVDRDPRDIYCDLVELEKLIGKDIAQSHDAMKYVKWHKKYRENSHIQNENILRIQFEDLILKYDETIEQILNFLEIDEKSHSQKMTFFNPEVSKKNVGKYKDFPYQDEIRILEKELESYLYPLKGMEEE